MPFNTDLGPTTGQRKWTSQSYECYYLSFKCDKCSVTSWFKPRCRCKAAVAQLIKQGVPIPEKFVKERQDIINDSYTREYNQVIEDTRQKMKDINFDQIKTYIKYNEEDEELIR